MSYNYTTQKPREPKTPKERTSHEKDRKFWTKMNFPRAEEHGFHKTYCANMRCLFKTTQTHGVSIKNTFKKHGQCSFSLGSTSKIIWQKNIMGKQRLRLFPHIVFVWTIYFFREKKSPQSFAPWKWWDVPWLWNVRRKKNTWPCGRRMLLWHVVAEKLWRILVLFRKMSNWQIVFAFASDFFGFCQSVLSILTQLIF